LLIDLDSQASATSTFGYIPDRDISFDDTCLPFFDGREDLAFCIRKTHWDGLDLIPSNLNLYQLEFALSGEIKTSSREDKKELFNQLKVGIDTISHNYDIVIMDSPPALGMISISITCAADGIIVPTPPAMYDFSSTVQFFRMVHDVVNTVAPEKDFDFIKILATKANLQQTAHQDFLTVMRKIFGSRLLKSIFLRTAEVENAASNFKTILEEDKPQKKAYTIVHNACREIELEILKQWPSKMKSLEEIGEYVF
jgi:chromosome partitioning protein